MTRKLINNKQDQINSTSIVILARSKTSKVLKRDFISLQLYLTTRGATRQLEAMLPAPTVKRPSSFSIESLMSKDPVPANENRMVLKRPLPTSHELSDSPRPFKSAVHQLQEHCNAINRRQSTGTTPTAPGPDVRHSPLPRGDIRHHNPIPRLQQSEPTAFHADFVRQRPDPGSFQSPGLHQNIFGGVSHARPFLFQGHTLHDVQLVQQSLLRLPGLIGGHHPYLQMAPGHPQMFPGGGPRSPTSPQDDNNTFYTWLLSRHGTFFNPRIHAGIKSRHRCLSIAPAYI